MDTDSLQRGDLVVAAQDLDPDGACVKKGTPGVVFEEADAYGDDGGPMVRWFSGGACNVYDGDVVFPDQDADTEEEEITPTNKDMPC